MGQHRKTKHYRRIVIAAAAVGAVGVPSVALACAEWPYGTDGQAQTVATPEPVGQWQYTPGNYQSNGADTGAPSATVPPAPWTTAAPSTRPSVRVIAPPHAKKHPKKHARKHTRRTATVPTPRWTATPSAPKPTASASAAPAAPSTPKPTATASGVTAEILRLVNAERSKAGCQALTLNSTLTKAAQAHSQDMAAHQNMSHTGSDGSSPGDRITRAGYVWSSYGENVAYGYGTAEQVMAGWMSSPGHRANILNCGFKEIGVGLAQPGSYWTQDFGTAR
ncbi:CAP domain-containing protein [Streptomyces cyanogenus]|uniref:Cysteine-rich secretory protein family protein n=1 Tax=Streptomyces cyanogenus TaxID=80860 RepID=A0ABX7TJ11_STRCY|nr:CAP domain-containing protein [Streptomyces cyanogenus]QTD96517.1 Cysteine-rich secretory protein family protein [Streptomyces cyanogenus]